MIIEIDADGTMEILEPSDFTRFSLRAVRASPLPDSAAVKFEGENFAWISEEALKAWPGAEDRPAWLEGVTAMLNFAGSRGWVDPLEGRVRAHIEWVDLAHHADHEDS